MEKQRKTDKTTARRWGVDVGLSNNKKRGGSGKNKGNAGKAGKAGKASDGPNRPPAYIYIDICISREDGPSSREDSLTARSLILSKGHSFDFSKENENDCKLYSTSVCRLKGAVMSCHRRLQYMLRVYCTMYARTWNDYST
jgi:hypothetical protein